MVMSLAMLLMDAITACSVMLSSALVASSKIKSLGIQLKDISTEQSSLESIFLNLVKESENELVRS